MEVSSVDSENGAIFYSLNQRDSQEPVFTRRDECRQCHASPKTLGVPGHMARSFYTGADGFPQFHAGGFHTGHRSPFKQRWGGWYVSGMHNLITRKSYETRMALSQQEGMNKALSRLPGEWSDSTRRRIFGASKVLLKYMLFADEMPLKAAVKGPSTFQADFSTHGPRDSKGRSLREFDLKTRIFR